MEQQDKIRVEELFALLKKHNWLLASAESFTGGGFANQITNIAGASAVFVGSIVTYTNQMKHDFLSVDEGIFKKYGAISIPCAQSMARGCLIKTKSQIAISFTGNADRDVSEKKLPFFAYLGISYQQNDEWFSFTCDDKPEMNRETFKILAIRFGIEKLIEILKKV